MRDFNPITGRTFRPSNSVSEPGRFHFLSETHPTERSHSHTSPGAKGWDFRRDAIFHGHHYHRYAGAWVLINDDYDPSEDFYLPPAPYEFTGEEGFSDNDSPRDAGSPDLIGIAVQTKLTRLGYYHGKIDGVLGTATRDAISAFQRDNGLRVTGYVNADLVEALKL